MSKMYLSSAAVSAAYFGGQNVLSDPYMFAAPRALWPVQGFAASAGSVYEVSVLYYRSPPYAITSPRFLLTNTLATMNTNAEAALGNAVIWNGISVELGTTFNGNGTVNTRGTCYPVTIGGLASDYTLADNSWIWTDENSITIPANTIFGVVCATQVASGEKRPCSQFRTAQSLGDGKRQSATALASYLSSGTITASDGTIYTQPAFIVAKGWQAAGQPPVPIIIGDSISVTGNDATYLDQADGVWQYGPKGLWDNASSTRYAYGHLGISGIGATHFNAGTFVKRKAALLDINATGPFSCVLSELGLNDGPASIKTSCNTLWAYLKSIFPTKKLIQTTITPKPTLTTANIGYTTVANQVSSYGSGAGSWADFHDYLLARGAYSVLPANLDAVVNVRPAFESATDSGKYNCTGWNTTLAANYTASSTTCSLVAAPTVGMALMGAVGDVGGTLKTLGIVRAVSGSGPYTVTLYGPTAGGLTAPSAIWEVDCDLAGVHPFTSANNRARDVVIAAKNANVFV